VVQILGDLISQNRLPHQVQFGAEAVFSLDAQAGVSLPGGAPIVFIGLLTDIADGNQIITVIYHITNGAVAVDA